MCAARAITYLARMAVRATAHRLASSCLIPLVTRCRTGTVPVSLRERRALLRESARRNSALKRIS